jgi:hypothetical protein
MVAYIESPLDRIVDVHFGKPPPPPTNGGGGTLTFYASGQNVTLPAQNGLLQDSAGWFGEVRTGEGISHAPSDDRAFIRGSGASVSGGIFYQITGGVNENGRPPDPGQLSMSGSIYFRNAETNDVLFEHHADQIQNTAPGDPADSSGTAQFSGSFPISGEGMFVKVSFSAQMGGGGVVLGFVRTFPNSCKISV